MLKMILVSVALIAATQAQSSNKTLLPEGVSCTDLFWNSDIAVKGKLSTKEECWLTVHRADKDSGVLGDKLWIRIEGKYFSVSKSKLRANFSTEEDAQEALQIEFIKQHKEWKKNGNN